MMWEFEITLLVVQEVTIATPRSHLLSLILLVVLFSQVGLMLDGCEIDNLLIGEALLLLRHVLNVVLFHC
jgi:hypothetical protein